MEGKKKEIIKKEYGVCQRGCSLTYSARTPPVIHPGITIWVDKIEIDIGMGIFLKFFESIFLLFRQNLI